MCGKRKVVTVYTKKVSEGVVVQLHSFFIWVLDGAVWLFHTPALLPQEQDTPLIKYPIVQLMHSIIWIVGLLETY